MVNYGSVLTDPEAITRIQARILGNFGGADRGIPAADAQDAWKRIDGFFERLLQP